MSMFQVFQVLVLLIKLVFKFYYTQKANKSGMFIRKDIYIYLTFLSYLLKVLTCSSIPKSYQITWHITSWWEKLVHNIHKSVLTIEYENELIIIFSAFYELLSYNVQIIYKYIHLYIVRNVVLSNSVKSAKLRIMSCQITGPNLLDVSLWIFITLLYFD